ncbi:MAG: hypothetical protein M0R06_16075 [Sphaerochaeta sp.]|jgi:hypothetical protein|nr:hypothetical protein [Sphaerochaeta sp.]
MTKKDWTAKQVIIYNALMTGASLSQVANQTKSSYSAVSKIKKIMDAGEIPPAEMLKQEKEISKAQTKFEKEIASSEKMTSHNDQPQGQQEDQSSQEEDDESITKQNEKDFTSIGQSDPQNYSQELATYAKMFPKPAYIPITPIMQSAKSYVIQRLKWSPDVKWHDLIDTVFYNYFKLLDPPVILQGWVEGDPVGNPPEKAREEGNGHKKTKINFEDPEIKGIVEEVSKQLILQMEKIGGLE